MDNEIHDVVKLLVARMKSHPEEFRDAFLNSQLTPHNHYGEGRWEPALSAAYKHANDAEAEALDAGLRPIRLSETHEWVLDELCNGDERRRKAEEEAEASRQLYAKQVAMSQAQLQAQLQNTYYNPVTNTNHIGPGSLLGSGSASTLTNTYANQLNQAMTDTKKSMIKFVLGKVFK